VEDERQSNVREPEYQRPADHAERGALDSLQRRDDVDAGDRELCVAQQVGQLADHRIAGFHNQAQGHEESDQRQQRVPRTQHRPSHVPLRGAGVQHLVESPRGFGRRFFQRIGRLRVEIAGHKAEDDAFADRDGEALLRSHLSRLDCDPGVRRSMRQRRDARRRILHPLRGRNAADRGAEDRDRPVPDHERRLLRDRVLLPVGVARSQERDHGHRRH
jgi:hypothetical protein